MTEYKKTGRLVGLLFLVTYATYIIGALLMHSGIGLPFDAAAIREHRSLIVTGMLLELVCGFGILGIPSLLGPLLERDDSSRLIAYTAFRIIEAVAIFIASMLCLLIIWTSFADERLFPLGTMLIEWTNLITDVWVPLPLGIGGFFFYDIMRRRRFLPSFLVYWGIVGYPLVAIGGMIEAYGIPFGTYFALPIALNELVLGIYLLVKGFNTREAV